MQCERGDIIDVGRYDEKNVVMLNGRSYFVCCDETFVCKYQASARDSCFLALAT